LIKVSLKINSPDDIINAYKMIFEQNDNNLTVAKVENNLYNAHKHVNVYAIYKDCIIVQISIFYGKEPIG